MKKYKKYDAVTEAEIYDFDYNTSEKERLRNQIANKTNLDIEDLRSIAMWKLNRVIDVSEDVIKKLQSLSSIDNLSTNDSLVEEVINGLLESRGIGLPMASTILKFLRPEVFPIIDVRAFRSLYGVKPKSKDYTYEGYVKYVNDITKLVNNKKHKLNLKLNQVDEQLYCFDRKENNKI